MLLLRINLGEINITIVSLPFHEYDIPLTIFRSSLNSLINVWQLSACSLHTYVVSFIAKYFTFCAPIVNMLLEFSVSNKNKIPKERSQALALEGKPGI